MSHQPIELHAIDMGNHDNALGKCGILSARIPFGHLLSERVDRTSSVLHWNSVCSVPTYGDSHI